MLLIPSVVTTLLATPLQILVPKSLQGYVDPKHEAGKLTQQITKRTLRATEAWTDGGHAVDDKYVELDYELAVVLANVTEGAVHSSEGRSSGAKSWFHGVASAG